MPKTGMVTAAASRSSTVFILVTSPTDVASTSTSYAGGMPSTSASKRRSARDGVGQGAGRVRLLLVDHDEQVARARHRDRFRPRPGPRLRLLGVDVGPGQALGAEQPVAVAPDEGVLERVADRRPVHVAQADLLDHRRTEDRVVTLDLRRREARGVVHGVAHRRHGQLAQVVEEGLLGRHEVVVRRVDGGQEGRAVVVEDRLRPLLQQSADLGRGRRRWAGTARRPARRPRTTSTRSGPAAGSELESLAQPAASARTARRAAYAGARTTRSAYGWARLAVTSDPCRG